MRKGRTARFAQDLSLDEIAIAAKWAAEEEIAEKRAAWNRRKNQKTLKAEIIDFPRLPMAANGRWIASCKQEIKVGRSSI